MEKKFMERLKDAVRSSMGLKLVITLSGWITVLMLLGSLFVGRMLLDYQYRAMEQRGRDIGMVLGKASVDRLIAKDLIGLNMLVEDVVRSQDIISVVFTNTDGTPITSARASFNARNGDVKAVRDAENTDDVAKLSAAIRRKLSPIEVASDVLLGGTRLAEVRMAFSRAEARMNTAKVVALLLGTSLVIVLSISVLIYFMARRMITAPTSAAEAAASAIAAGDLTQNVRVSTIDEIGNLGRGLNRMVIGLKGMIGNIRGSSEQLVLVSGEVTDVAVSVSSASRVQNEALEEAASSVNEMHFSLKEIGANVQDLYTTSEHTASSVLEMGASIDEVAGTMSELSSSIEQTSTAITQMSAAVRQIAENAGVEGSIVVGKILENASPTFGFNAQTEEYVDLVQAGVIDPAKVVRTALQDAASVAGLLITTEAAVAEAPKKPEAGANAAMAA